MDGDFYVVFSSVHEALIHSSKLCSLEELENLLRISNGRMTFQKEFLTDKVYYYCREEDKFIMLQGSLKMLVTTIRMDEENYMIRNEMRREFPAVSFVKRRRKCPRDTNTIC